MQADDIVLSNGSITASFVPQGTRSFYPAQLYHIFAPPFLLDNAAHAQLIFWNFDGSFSQMGDENFRLVYDAPGRTATAQRLQSMAAAIGRYEIADSMPPLAATALTRTQPLWDESAGWFAPGWYQVFINRNSNGSFVTDAQGKLTNSLTTHSARDAILLTREGDIANLATITASSVFAAGYAAGNVADSVIGLADRGEWASAGELNPHLALAWTQSHCINKVVLYDRIDSDDANVASLTFADNTTLQVQNIPTRGLPAAVKFAPTWSNSLLVQVLDGSGANVGLSEVEVFEAPAAACGH